MSTSPSTPSLIFDHGTSLFIGCEALDDAGDPASLVGVDVTGRAEHKEGGDVQVFDLEWVDRAAGRYELWAPGDGLSTSWRLGTWEARIVYSKTAGGTGGRTLVLGTEVMNLLIRKAP